ncbi:MAG: nucleotidyltransferase family protein, partial [Bacteroidota bacterium]
ELDELIIVRPTPALDFLPAELLERVTIAVNPQPERGMTSSIQAALPLISPKTTGIMIALADMPLIRTADYNRIISAFQASLASQATTIAVPFHAGQKGNPVIFSAYYLDALRDNPHPEGARLLIKAEWDNLCRVEMETKAVLLDVDTPEDYRGL